MDLHRLPSPDKATKRQTFSASNRRCSRRLFQEPGAPASPDSTYADESDFDQAFTSHGQDFSPPGKHEDVRATLHCLEGLEHLKPPELDYGAKYLQPLSSPAKKTPRGFRSGRSVGSPTRSPRRRSAQHAGKRYGPREHGRSSPRLDQEPVWPKQPWGEPPHKVSPKKTEEFGTSQPSSAYWSPRTKPSQQPSLKAFLAQGSSSRGLGSSALHPRVTVSLDADEGQTSPCIKAGTNRLLRAPSYQAEAAKISPASSLSALEDPFALCASPTASEFEDVAITPRQTSVLAVSREVQMADEPVQQPSTAQSEVVGTNAAVAESVDGEDVSASSGQMLCPPPPSGQIGGSAVKKKKSRSIFTSCLPSLSKPAVQKENRAMIKPGQPSETIARPGADRGQESKANPFKGLLNIFTGMLFTLCLLYNGGEKQQGVSQAQGINYTEKSFMDLSILH